MARPSSPSVKKAPIASSLLALLLIFLSAPRSWSAVDGLDASAPDVPAAVPTLVQHVATGMDRYPINTLTIQLPNPVRAGNCLILGVQFNSAGSVASVTDDQGNTWIAGPTATNVSFSKRMDLHYVQNAIAGTQTIKVHFNGINTPPHPGFPQAVVSEFYNVATSNAFDGSAASSSSRTAGTITTTAPGDLIYEWGASLSSSDINGGAFNGTSITAGTGFTLLSADLQVGSGDQYHIQPAAGPITPTFEASGSEVWGSVAIALKSATAGTPPPPGVRIIHLQHTLLQAVRAQNREEPIVMQFPSSGNLLVGLYNAAGPFATNVTDSLGNTWSLPDEAKSADENELVSAQIVYAANAQTSPNLSGITVSITETDNGDMMFNLYDITGAATSPFDLATALHGVNETFVPLTTGTIAPRTTNGLVLHVNSITYHQHNEMTSPIGGAFDTVTNDLESPDVSTLDMDNAYANIYNATTSQVDFTFTSCCSQTGVGPWAGVSVAFKGDGNATPTPTAPPSATPTPSVTPSPTVTPGVTPTPTTSPTASPTPTPTPRVTPRPRPTRRPRPTPPPRPVEPISIVDENGQLAPNGVPSAASQTFDVTVGQGFTFTPSEIGITAGDTVRWTWASSGHSVTSGDPCTANGQFCSPDNTNCAAGILSNAGTVYEHTFSAPGSYSYFCSAHCSIGMTGVVNVAPAPRPTPRPRPSLPPRSTPPRP